jgi:hypothetical protein
MSNVRSFKMQLRDEHVRIMPSVGLDGAPFVGPGVTLRGDDARRAIALARSIFDGLAAFEPGIVVRSLSVDLERRRILATLEPTTPEADPRGRVVRMDGGAADMILGPANELIEYLAGRCEAALLRRDTA